jgi:hypothetical protein
VDFALHFDGMGMLVAWLLQRTPPRYTPRDVTPGCRKAAIDRLPPVSPGVLERPGVLLGTTFLQQGRVISKQFWSGKVLMGGAGDGGHSGCQVGQALTVPSFCLYSALGDLLKVIGRFNSST